MASSNRHWPSMFKSKPCSNNTHHHQWQQDINPSSPSSCHRSSGCDERVPEPKPRWNPKPEQIRILEAIFNSGMVNPPRDEIRKIRAQLQEYGQVGDANVFYWFQNKKSRSKPKLKNIQNTKQSQHKIITTPSSSSSSSSDKSSPSGSVNQTYFHHPQSECLNEPFYFPVQQAGFTQGFGFSEVTNNGVQVPQNQTVGPCTSLMLSEILNHGDSRKEEHDEKMKRMQLQLSYTTTNAPSIHISPPPTATITTVPPSHNHHTHGVGEPGAVESEGAAISSSSSSSSSTVVFINDVAFEVTMGHFNVREAFGDYAMLINSNGQTVETDEWGLTLQSLQPGGFYYLLRSSTPLSV